MAKPKLIVFDLDYTLWPFWVDTHVTPPFNMAGNGRVYDAFGQQVDYYQDVPDILRKLHAENFTLAVASRTSCVAEARKLTELFNWDRFFTHKEIYPGSKLSHFKKFREYTNLPYSEMLFFDDEHRNIVEVGGLGVTAIHVPKPHGMTMKALHHGLQQFASNRSKAR